MNGIPKWLTFPLTLIVLAILLLMFIDLAFPLLTVIAILICLAYSGIMQKSAYWQIVLIVTTVYLASYFVQRTLTLQTGYTNITQLDTSALQLLPFVILITAFLSLATAKRKVGVFGA